MRPFRKPLILCTLLVLSGCQRSYTVPETPMPPNTVLLSQMMRQLFSFGIGIVVAMLILLLHRRRGN